MLLAGLLATRRTAEGRGPPRYTAHETPANRECSMHGHAHMSTHRCTIIQPLLKPASPPVRQYLYVVPEPLRLMPYVSIAASSGPPLYDPQVERK